MEETISDFKRLIVTFTNNPKKNNWPQQTFKLLNNKFLGSNWSVIVMQIEESEAVYGKVLVTKFCVILPRHGTGMNFLGGV